MGLRSHSPRCACTASLSVVPCAQHPSRATAARVAIHSQPHTYRSIERSQASLAPLRTSSCVAYKIASVRLPQARVVALVIDRSLHNGRWRNLRLSPILAPGGCPKSDWPRLAKKPARYHAGENASPTPCGVPEPPAKPREHQAYPVRPWLPARACARRRPWPRSGPCVGCASCPRGWGRGGLKATAGLSDRFIFFVVILFVFSVD